MSKVLSYAGHDCVIASHFAPALQALDRQPFDLLIADIVFPRGVNGLSLSYMAQRRSPGLRVLYVTGYDIPEDGLPALGRIRRKPITRTRLPPERYAQE